MKLHHYLARLAYRGALFHGATASPPHRTVESEWRLAIARATGQGPGRLAFCARTDVGVHARDQRLSFVLTRAIPADQLATQLRTMLPGDMRLHELRASATPISARAIAIAKHYRYRVIETAALHARAWSIAIALDEAALLQVAGLLAGERSHAALAWRVRKPGQLQRVDVVRVRTRRLASGARLWCIDIIGNRFLRQMVRRMVGLMMLVGTGQLGAHAAIASVAGGDALAYPAPAHGLTLQRVLVGPSPTDDRGTSDAQGSGQPL